MSEARRSDQEVWVVGLGAHSVVGNDAASCAASVRAGIARTGEHPSATLTDGDPMVVAMIPSAGECTGAERLAALAAPAVEQALEPLAAVSPPPDALPLILGLPCPRPGLADDVAAGTAAALARQQEQISEVQPMASGHAAGVAALARGLSLLHDQTHELCVVGGVDSWIEPETLAWLAAEQQVFCGANPHGFFPGEGAGCLLLAPADTACRLELPCLGRILAAATADTAADAAVNTGVALTTAWRRALEALPDEQLRIHQLVGDLNGQPDRAQEFAYALIRNRERFTGEAQVLAPADRWGDVGAASAPLALALASRAGTRGHAPGHLALIWASSCDGLRGAAIIDTGGLEAPHEPTFFPRS